MPKRNFLSSRGAPMETGTLTQLLKQHADLCTFFYREGIFAKDFVDMHRLQDPFEPELLREVVELFFRDVETQLNEMDILLKEQEVDYGKLKKNVASFRESSRSIGLRTLVITCDAFKTCYRTAQFEGCMGCLKHLKDDYYVIKRKLGELLQLEDQIIAAGGTYPIIEYPRKKTKMALIPKRHRVYGD